jgi:hypothetical protein
MLVRVVGVIVGVTSEVASEIPGRTLRTLRLFGVADCLELKRAESPA